LAIGDFDESIRLQKNNAVAFGGRGRAKLVIGDLKGSIADYSEAIRLSPDTAQLFIEWGHVYLESGDIVSAIRDETEALKLEPRNAIALNERGVAYFKKGDLAAAEQDLTEALKTLPAAEIFANRGNVENAQGNSADAIRDFRQALLDDPSLVQARDALRRLGALEPVATDTDRRVRQGRQLAEKNCSRCHSVSARGASPNKEAPAFRNLSQRHPLYWLRQPSTRGIQATHERMPKFNVSAAQIDTIVAYINSLSTSR
jgi:tetratricopeptide (TPR) repeat protein